MKIGQMSLAKISPAADFLQLDVCGLSPEEALHRYEDYSTDIPVILHGDWSKKGASENDILKPERVQDYIEMVQRLQNVTTLYGITLHPPFRRKISFPDFLTITDQLENSTGIPVFIENRSAKNIWASSPQEIIDLSYEHDMTLDIPQLYISCGYDVGGLMDVLQKVYLPHIKEIHCANIKRDGSHTYVGRKLIDGELPLEQILPLFQGNRYCTLEILGGVPTFETQKNIIEEELTGIPQYPEGIYPENAVWTCQRCGFTEEKVVVNVMNIPITLTCPQCNEPLLWLTHREKIEEK